MELSRSRRPLLLVAQSVFTVILGGASGLLGVCGPFTDVSDAAFCPFVLEIFTLGITTGTSPTTYDPTSSVTRLQMAAFLSRSVDGVLRRGSRRAALDRFWTTRNESALALTTVGTTPVFLKSDGADVWVANRDDDTISRVRGSDGRLLETWTASTPLYGVLVAMGRVFVAGTFSPGKLYRIDPSQPAGAMTTVASNLGASPVGITFDGSRIWTANDGGTISIVTPAVAIPWTVTTVTTGFGGPQGILFDSANIWVADSNASTLLKLDSNGAVLQTVTVGSLANNFPVFDGANIWMPGFNSNSVSVVRVTSGVVLQTLTGNGLTNPVTAAFDGQRILVTNYGGNSVSLWKAADLTPIGSFPTGESTLPWGACSDGVSFWITLTTGRNQLARF